MHNEVKRLERQNFIIIVTGILITISAIIFALFYSPKKTVKAIVEDRETVIKVEGKPKESEKTIKKIEMIKEIKKEEIVKNICLDYHAITDFTPEVIEKLKHDLIYDREEFKRINEEDWGVIKQTKEFPNTNLAIIKLPDQEDGTDYESRVAQEYFIYNFDGQFQMRIWIYREKLKEVLGEQGMRSLALGPSVIIFKTAVFPTPTGVSERSINEKVIILGGWLWDR